MSHMPYNLWLLASKVVLKPRVAWPLNFFQAVLRLWINIKYLGYIHHIILIYNTSLMYYNLMDDYVATRVHPALICWSGRLSPIPIRLILNLPSKLFAPLQVLLHDVKQNQILGYPKRSQESGFWGKTMVPYGPIASTYFKGISLVFHDKRILFAWSPHGKPRWEFPAWWSIGISLPYA